MTTDTRFAETLTGLDAGALAALRDVMTLAIDLGPGKSTAFLRECLEVLDAAEGQPVAGSETLAPVLARWAVQS